MKRRWLVLLAVALAPSSAASGAIARSTADQPDDSGLPQIHLMYVVPSDGVDRGFDVNGTIVDSTASWEGWLAGQTGGRSLRLDTYLGQPDVTFARLPQSDSQIASNGPSVRDEVQRELHALGFDAPNKVYAVFYDGSSTFSCGGGAWPPALPGNVAALYLRGVSSGIPCPDVYAGPGQPPGYRDFSMIHEIMHTLGFVPTCAPHHTLAGHVSDDPSDLMYAGSAPWQPSILDVNHDDYYGANVPGCLDFAQSPYLTSSHGVWVVVNGPGTVTSTPAGIACPGSCAATFDGPVALTATPAAGAAFDGWSGACTGTGACTVTGDATVIASFSALATLTVTVEGKGSVAGGGIACPPTCTAALRAGTSVTLEATPAAGY
ncbi:MAG TPA: hypothetical protein VKJ07_26115, partial [Mycobacteriales bacterium]|nr:hypothetical protein [Mycobacteriales bacterium]